MTPEQADILVELERHPFFEGLYDVVRARSPEWPTTLVVLRDDSGYALGVVTASLLRVLPDADRAHVGVIASKRLRDLLLPLSERLTLDPLARVLANARASAREAARPPERMHDAAVPALPPLIALLARVESATTARVFVVCAEGSAEWVAAYVRNVKSLRVCIEEEPLDADALVRVMQG